MTLLGIVPLFCAAATGIVQNGDFESGLTAWKTDGGGSAWRVEKGVGRPPQPSTPPTAALVWERKSGDAKGGWIGSEMPVEPGKLYRLTAWVAVDELVNNKNRPGFSVDIGNANGYSLSACRTRVNDKCEVDLDGWRKLTAVTPPIPGDADRMIFKFTVDEDATGRVRFDDVTVESCGERAIDRFTCLAPGRAKSEGPVFFSASVCIDRTRYPVETLRPVLRWNGGSQPMSFVAEDQVEADVEATSFPMGRNDVTLSVETAEGTVIASAQIDFTRTAPDTASRKTKFDARKRLLVDGKPTYPLGIYWHYSNDGDESCHNLLGMSPFNFVISYAKDLKTTDELDRFHKRGIAVVSSLAHAYGWMQYRPAGVTDDASAERHVDRVVNMIKDHPAHWGWYLVDEPPVERIPSVLDRYRRVKELDPDHICGVVTWTPNEARTLSQCCDFFGVDSYPIGELGASETEKVFPRLYEITRECVIARELTKGRQPLWNVPQAFNWQDDHRKRHYWWMRMPTREEYVSQAWQEIASGADGICWFMFDRVYKDWKRGNRRSFYDLCAAMEDVRRLSPVLLSVDEPPTIAGADKNLTARAFLYEGNAYVVACNLTWNRRAATLTLGGKWQKPMTEVGAPARLDGGNKLKIDLPPIGVSVIRLEPLE